MLKSTGLNGSNKADAAWISQFSGEEVTEEMVKDGSAEAYWKKVSPYTYITDDSVPILFAYGVLDGIVPPASRLVLEQALKEHNVTNVGLVYEKSGHMLICDPDKQRLFIEYMDKFCAKYFLGEDIEI
jgi:dipeptidyl aminopeptidase/acylaminoacyl peptidase